ncbi:membrane protein insertion efficiency factor YidD [Modestobacter sp. I12A-02628]|uniref:Putative membrane protein insertion efficiency factor n=1 Tax=Goekera deserti TaxID=2497753 RepID=A0A7K3WFZ3_9ACTN|nr:membrane protein insertion efficiency factor YidD [Goekera deserti]NDI49914.1 membrane protein insertion efficiency factor YidD [Goekera deserti]NEL55276.1 membrane protein insertion efficiency factor YidD [Goekera deserti]
MVSAVRWYQRAVSPVLPPRCRFHPSCSAYAAEALEVHGAGRGSWLALVRLAKCAPWHPGGVDLVPPARTPAGAGAPRGGTDGGSPSSEQLTTGPAARTAGGLLPAPDRPARVPSPAPPRPDAEEETSVA